MNNSGVMEIENHFQKNIVIILKDIQKSRLNLELLMFKISLQLIKKKQEKKMTTLKI